MCGIIGYVGNRNAPDVIIQGLRYLEYRGYDSSGIAVWSGEKFDLVKTKGRIADLEKELLKTPVSGHLAIGHTRWATHGCPADRNAHPFVSYNSRFAVVHNGIIENYLEIKDELQKKGVVFTSETDSEVIAHLLESLDHGDVKRAVLDATARLKGAYAIGIICADDPDVLYAVRKDNPLVVGVTESDGFICSDINSIQKFLTEVVVLENGQVAKVERGRVELFDFDGNDVEAKFIALGSLEESDRKDFECYMDKEIKEIPTALANAIATYRNGAFNRIDKKYLRRIRRINVVACGTALHAGLYGERMIKKYLKKIDVTSEAASEFRYGDPKVDDRTLTITVSQSGETADTLVCQNMVRNLGGKTLTICNVETSSMVRSSDYALFTSAGPEVAVASTKAYNCQCLVFLLFVLDLARLRGEIDEFAYKNLQADIDALPEIAARTLKVAPQVARFANKNYTRKSVFYIGRGLDYCTAMEGSLKLKEISYIHCEAYPAGELKHGTLALIEEGVLVIALVTQKELVTKSASGLEEVKSRGANVLAITPFYDRPAIAAVSDYRIKLPDVNEDLYPIISVIPTQLLAYYIARAKGCDIDKPRNLAKSVTVE
ncbi:MAG: glutamine--fructose-6-phosphate transaminase (isomerizing) [Clostridia bacterium]|nr:glutamine--fructose-6-phosphate transaminase (isomerizing) [Clostridia bacterium]